ncbi:hypothetical protein QUB05_27805 [Microcoleus sp. F10-C6]|uniref:hypothetical protein n=1 Tax=unclassified Microcoleus TaxID=2642155 RepID=UPI002FD1E283
MSGSGWILRSQSPENRSVSLWADLQAVTNQPVAHLIYTVVVIETVRVAVFPVRPLLLDLNAATVCEAFLILGDRTSSLPKSSPPISVNNFTYNECQISCEI